MINKNLKISFHQEPYPFLIIEDFLEQNIYEDLERNFPSLDDFKDNKSFVKRMDYDTSYGDTLYNNLISNNQNYNKLNKFVYSKKFRDFFFNYFSNSIKNEIKNENLSKNILDLNFFEKPFETDEIINKKSILESSNDFLYSRVDIGLGLKDYGIKSGGRGPHIDNPQRLISMLFYLGGYKKMIGGEHRIWQKFNNELKLYKSIKPKPNLLIASLQTNRSFHDVNPVIEITGTRNAFYMALSCTKKIWKEVKSDQFNRMYNKNRVKINFFQKLINKIHR